MSSETKKAEYPKWAAAMLVLAFCFAPVLMVIFSCEAPTHFANKTDCDSCKTAIVVAKSECEKAFYELCKDRKGGWVSVQSLTCKMEGPCK